MVSQKSKTKSPSNGTKITSYFTTKNENSGKLIPTTKCPLCKCPATIREVNQHLDSGCPSQVTSNENENSDCKTSLINYECDKNDDSKEIKFHAQESKISLSESKECSTVNSTSEKQQSDFATKANTTSEKSSVTYRATKSISSSPSKRNNLNVITQLTSSDSKSTSIILSPTKSVPKLHFSSPTKNPQNVMKQLFNKPTDNIVQHTPLSPSKKQDPLHVPYYLTNFEAVLRGVLEETDDGELFLPEEKEYVNRFRGLSINERKLYVRLFQRKHTWLQTNKIRYEEISNVDDVANSLVNHGFLINNSGIENDLDTILELLSAGSLKILCKDLNFSVEGTKQKSDHIEAIKKHLKRKQTCVFSQSGSDKFRTNICRRANKLLGNCYMLNQEPRKIFLRIISLYSLSDWWDERENNKGGPPATLTTILLKNTGRLVYPLYNTKRQTKIFPSRSHLLQFEEAFSLESDYSEALENDNIEKAINCGKEAEELFMKTLNCPNYTEHALDLPIFLRKFTPGSILAYLLSQVVEMFEKSKDHENAVILLRKLIAQDMYLPTYHGHWYERLCLDLDIHLKKPKEALEEAGRGFKDPYVRQARRLSLCKRIKQICYAKKNKKIREHYGEETLQTIENMYPHNFDEVVIQGRLMPKAPSLDRTGLQGGKSIFVFGDKCQGEQLLCSVEEFVKETYKYQGYPNGIHAEGSVVNTIFTILFWDIIYNDDLPDVFRTPHQAVPLDFDTDDFYNNRKQFIDKRIEEIRNWEFATLSEVVTNVWDSWANSVNSCPANWDLFPLGLEQLIGLLKCFANYQLSGICERLAKDHRHSRSGFPDLTVWNPNEDSKNVAFIEVKGPNDILSPKQILWLNYLQSLDIEAFVCHVEATNAKTISSPKMIKRKQISSNDDSLSSTNEDLSAKKSQKATAKKCDKKYPDVATNDEFSNIKEIKKRKSNGRKQSAATKRQKKPCNDSTETLSQQVLESVFDPD